MSAGVAVLAGEQLVATFFGVIVGLGVMKFLSKDGKAGSGIDRPSGGRVPFSTVLDNTVNKINDHHAGSEKLGTMEVQGIRLRIVKTNRQLRDMLWWPEGVTSSTPRSLYDIIDSDDLRAEISGDVQDTVIQKEMTTRLRQAKKDILVKRCNGSTVRVNVVFGSSEDGSVTSDSRFFVVMTLVDGETDISSYRPRRKSYEAAVQMYGKHVADAVVNGELPKPENFAYATVLFLDVTNYAEMIRRQGQESGKGTEWISKVHAIAEDLLKRFSIRKIQSWGEMFLLVAGTGTSNGDDADTQVTRMVKFAERFNTRLARELTRSSMELCTCSCSCEEGKGGDHCSSAGSSSSGSNKSGRGSRSPTASSFDGELVNDNAPIRVGIHVGPITITYIATHKFAPTMSIFGDTVNTAARMEQSGQAGMVHMTEEAADQMCRENAKEWGEFRPPRQIMTIKSKGEMPTVWYDLVRRVFPDMSAPEPAVDILQKLELQKDTSPRQKKDTSPRSLQRNNSGKKIFRHNSEELMIDAAA